MKDAQLRKDTLWKAVYDLAAEIYGKVDELVAQKPDEKWHTAIKLQNASSDSLFYTAQAVASAVPAATEYELNSARKNLFALQSTYLIATKQHLFELDPEVIVKIDVIIAMIDTRMLAAREDKDASRKEELEPWLEKYRIWQKLNEK